MPMPVLFSAIAATSGLAAAALSVGVLRHQKSNSNAKVLGRLLPKEFSPTHRHLDTRGRYLLACDMKSATVFIADKSKDANDPTHLPINQLESVALTEVGEMRVCELRLDISLADERRTVVSVHFLNGPAGRNSSTFEKARAHAGVWETRLNSQSADADSLRKALAADTAPTVTPLPGWQTPSASALAGVCLLALVGNVVTPAETTSAPSLAAASPVASPAQKTTTTPATVAAATPGSEAETIDLQTFLEPFEQRIDDISERSLMQTSRASTTVVLKVLNSMQDIRNELEQAEALVQDDADQRLLDAMTALLASTQQDILPRFRRLYSIALQKDSDLPLNTRTGGYASRDLLLTNESFIDEDARETFLQTVAVDLRRLRFDSVRFRSSNDSGDIETRDLETNSDTVLAAALPMIEAETTPSSQDSIQDLVSESAH